ncbi:TRAP transporter substrate-binding protein [Bacillus sp. Marseille-P3661]|uniref:TRAP transporter substrate-binding protein n=1 Tax=Bacillus sp. Marseille-P3661 TaxID=1936234 RepID=UPI000C84EC42|nr:TRAP transporter substrate-binding protein [Bacillus sp. Marseille-P3661]
MKDLKNIKFMILGMLILILMAACGNQPSTESTEPSKDREQAEGIEPVSLKLGYVVARQDDHPYTVAAETFAKNVEEKTNGSVVVELYPGGQLGGDREMFEGIKMGTLELGVISSPVIAGFTPVLGGVDMPWLFENNYDLLYKAQSGEPGRKILDALERDTGVKALTFTYQPFRHFWTNKPIETIDDFTGIKLRSMESNIHLDTWKALGANPTPVPYPEVYTAMQTNTIDGFESDVIGGNASKFYEVAKHITLSGHFNNSVVLIMNDKAWNSLDSDQQKAVEESAVLAADASMEITKQVEKKYMNVMKEEGVTINEIDIEVLKEHAEETYNKYSETPEVKEFIEDVKSLK